MVVVSIVGRGKVMNLRFWDMDGVLMCAVILAEGAED